MSLDPQRTPSAPEQPSGDLAHSVLKRIEAEHVTPRPRWQFSLRDQVIWSVWGACLLLAAAVSAAGLFALTNAGWEFRRVTHGGVRSFFLEVVPSVWILILLVLLFLAYQNIRRTTFGYRYRISLVIGLTLIGSFIGGVLLYSAGLGETVEQEIGRRIPLYRPTMLHQQAIWVNPSGGFLAGQVTRVEPDGSAFFLKAFDGTVWTLPTQEIDQRGRDMLVPMRIVRVVGFPAPASSTQDIYIFHPCFVFPWKIHGQGMMIFSKKRPSPNFIPLNSPETNPERIDLTARITNCEDVRPYQILKKLQEGLHP